MFWFFFLLYFIKNLLGDKILLFGEKYRENQIVGQGIKNRNICGIGRVEGKCFFREVGIDDGWALTSYNVMEISSVLA